MPVSTLGDNNSRSGGGDASRADAQLMARMQRWADGRGTLKDVRGYSDEELYAIARTAYAFYNQGHLEKARTLFQGLYAVSPADPYFAKALGVVELASGNAQGALAAYDVALKLDSEDVAAYVGRAEVKLVLGQVSQAVDDLRRASGIVREEDPQRDKVFALLAALNRR
ncbi:MAG: tetratricopeptide repeat protein [Myxococcaceae bacterium]